MGCYSAGRGRLMSFRLSSPHWALREALGQLGPTPQAGVALQGSSPPTQRAAGGLKPASLGERPVTCIPAREGREPGPKCDHLTLRAAAPFPVREAYRLPAVTLRRTRSDRAHNKAPLLHSFQEATDSKTPGSHHPLCGQQLNAPLHSGCK